MRLEPTVTEAPLDRSLASRLALVLSALTLARLAALWLNATDLFFDEAQYWEWSRELAWGYYSKPPVIAWLIALSTSVCGDGEADAAHDQYGTGLLLSYVAIVIAIGVATAVFARRTPTGGPLLGISAGCLWGASDVCIKALAGDLGSDPTGTLTHPLVIVIVGASLVGLTVSARSLQVGPPVGVIAMTTAAGNISTIVAGPVVFGEPFPDDAGGVLLRVLAFGLVIIAATLTPPPATAESTPAEAR